MKVAILEDILGELKVIDRWVVVSGRDIPPDVESRLREVLGILEEISLEIAEMDV